MGKPGRPTVLTASEEEAVLEAFLGLRQEGCVVDQETLCLLGRNAAQMMRGASVELSPDWAQSFRYALAVHFFVSGLCLSSAEGDTSSPS